MSGFSKLGIILTSVFSILLLALIAELLYLFWRRRQQCHRKSNRVEPTISSTPTILPPPNTIMGVSPHAELLKLEGIYGPPSRVLFTIKEEEKEEDIDETELGSSVVGESKLSGISLSDHHFGSLQFQLTGDSPEVIIMMGDSDFDVEPPFWTPCTSPPYHTPSSSPTREEKA